MNGSAASEERLEPLRVATVPTYDEAADAIEWLSSARFPIERGALVAPAVERGERLGGTRPRWRGGPRRGGEGAGPPPAGGPLPGGPPPPPAT